MLPGSLGRCVDVRHLGWYGEWVYFVCSYTLVSVLTTLVLFLSKNNTYRQLFHAPPAYEALHSRPDFPLEVWRSHGGEADIRS